MVDTSDFRPMDSGAIRKSLGFATDEFVWVCVGRMERPKGFDLLLETMAILAGRGYRVRLLLVGDGSERLRLERQARTLGLASQVRFHGQAERSEMPRLLNAGNGYLSASWREGFSVAILEAMACGLPAVTTDFGGAKEVVREGVTGFVSESRDPESLAERCEMLIRMDADALRRQCLEMARTYDAVTVTARIMSVLDSVRKPQRSSRLAALQGTIA